MSVFISGTGLFTPKEYITNEEFIGVTLAIGDTYGDDVRGNDLGAGHGG